MATVTNLRKVSETIPQPSKKVTKPKVRKINNQTVIGMVRTAVLPDNRLAMIIGCIFGGFVPLAVYMLVHFELSFTGNWLLQPKLFLVLGGLIYSAKTVVQWGKMAFRDTAKAIGFVALIEGVLVMSSTPWLSICALVLLVAVNAIATGVTLATQK